MNETGAGDTQPASSGGGGAMLRQAREEMGVHIAAVAVALKVPVRQLEALEQDRLDLLPDRTFARALAASVCRQLRIDPAPILAGLPQGAPLTVSVGEGINEPFHASSAPGSTPWREWLARPSVLIAAALLLAALALLLTPLFNAEDGDATGPGPVPQADAPPQADAASPAPAASAPAASGGLIVEPVTPAIVRPSAPPATPPASAVVRPAPAAPAARPATPAPTPNASDAKQP